MIEAEIQTSYFKTPIPVRSFDWVAYRDPEQIVGWGETEEQAINDFLKQESEQ